MPFLDEGLLQGSRAGPQAKALRWYYFKVVKMKQRFSLEIVGIMQVFYKAFRVPFLGKRNMHWKVSGIPALVGKGL